MLHVSCLLSFPHIVTASFPFSICCPRADVTCEIDHMNRYGSMKIREHYSRCVFLITELPLGDKIGDYDRIVAVT